jgi:hypothetical protein
MNSERCNRDKRVRRDKRETRHASQESCLHIPLFDEPLVASDNLIEKAVLEPRPAGADEVLFFNSPVADNSSLSNNATVDPKKGPDWLQNRKTILQKSPLLGIVT